MQAVGLEGFRLSVQQDRLWCLQEKDGVSYHALHAICIKGDLDKKVFWDVLENIIRRHEILRTFFSVLPGTDVVVQTIADHPVYRSAVADLQDISMERQQREIEAWITSLQSGGSSVFFGLLQLSTDRYIWIARLPALCADASTLRLLVQEFQQLYTACFQPEESGEEPLQYTDVSAWQNSLLQGEEAAAQILYWQEKQLSLLTTMRLPLERVPQGDQSRATCQKVALALDDQLALRIVSLAKHFNVSVSAFFLACWQIVLRRLGAEPHFLLGVACDGRMYEELASALGPYTRFVPVDAHLEKNLPFKQILADVAASLQESIERQTYFTWETAWPEPPDQALAFFPISFEYTCWPAAFTTRGLTLSLHHCASGSEPYILKLNVLQVGQRLQLEVSYRRERFGATAIQHIVSALHASLLSIVKQPAATMSTLNILNPAERQYIQETFQGPARPLPEQTLHQLFELYASRMPQQTALITAEQHLTYGELNARANQLARVLCRRGVGANVAVGLCLPRSAEMIVCLLAVFKAGGAYVPLDPESPATRLTFQLQHVQARLLLTQRQLLPRFLNWEGAALCLETLADELQQESSTNLTALHSMQDIAYIMYTSGSTGVPKAVSVAQQSVMNYTLALCELLHSQPGWHYATVSTLAADLGNTAIFCALASGGCLHVPDYETITSGDAFAAWVARQPVDVLKIVPSHLSALLQAQQASALLPHRALVLGGEVLPPPLLARLRETGCSCAIYNHYGPTEATIGILVHALDKGNVYDNAKASEQASVPLGRPIANSDVYVLDDWGQIVPVGVTGELYIGGAGLALGYAHHPELTAELFVPHPFSQVAGARLYRTGDLVCYRADGAIEFVGRRDDQVKLRGYRVELGEIEAQLRQQVGVREAVAQVRTAAGQIEQLLAYVVPWQRPGPSSDEMRRALAEQLPAYMLPARIVLLEQLPLTANGKLDRQRLPAPEEIREEAEQFIEARTPFEELLIGIWKELLGKERVSRTDNFFRSGGHSLLGTRLMARLQGIFRIEIPIAWLFEAPTVSLLAERLETALNGPQQQAIPPIERADRSVEMPLSYAQQRLWFLDQLEPGNTAYTIMGGVRLRGDLDRAALTLALLRVIERHEPLRTTFPSTHGIPSQHIATRPTTGLRWLDLRSLPQARRQQELIALAQQEAQEPFDLSRGPLLRCWLLLLEPQEHLLVLSLHHIISDGWSHAILLRELSTLYRALHAREAISLPPLPVHYADYALWQRTWLQGEVLERQLDYWRSQLAGLTPLALPTDAARPSRQTFGGAQHQMLLPLALREQVRTLAQQEGVTLFMLLLAAFQVLLARWSGQQDIAVGIPIANRRLPEVEGLIGFFVNTVVVRSDLSGNPSFRQLLERVREVCLHAYMHQDVPFEQVVEAVHPQRDHSRSPLFQIFFALQNTPEVPLHTLPLESEYFAIEQSTAKFDVSLVVAETAQGLSCDLQYNVDLFEAATITRMAKHWQVLLEGIVADPDQYLATLPLLTREEREQMLLTWNATRATYPANRCVHELFEEQVERTPDAIALRNEQGQITYALLNARTNQLAHALRRQQIAAEQRVGVCLPRSLDLVIGLLGILKAGGAYVPLEPDYPAERLASILTDSQAALLLTHSSLLARLPAGQTPVLCLDSEKHLMYEPCDNVFSGVGPQHQVYMIYTSGSTGQPKGVPNVHQALVNRLHWMQQAYQLDSQDRILQKTPFSFDVSAWEFFWPLLTGAGLVITQPEGQRDPAYLASLIAEQAITTLHFVPSMLHAFLQEPEVGTRCVSLRRVICSGEALPMALQQRFFASMPAGVQLHNLYGPTEAAIDVTSWECQRADTSATVPIGRPIANTQMYLLNEMMEPVPIGAPAELYIGGVGLARGYHRLPELTAERFVCDPFSSQAGARLFKTGDLARYRADGVIEFLGRSDHQVKLRGYRIELREIEMVLRRHPGVLQCAVVLQGTELEEKRLVAYIVFENGESAPAFSTMRSYLKKHLPDYMLPSRFVALDALPLTASGKVDRLALPMLYKEEREQQETDDAGRPLSPMEELVLRTWQQVLQREQIGIQENFFEIGGHSLLATRVIAQLRRLLGSEIPLRVIFEAATVASLATQLEDELRQGQGLSTPPLVVVPRTQDMPLSYAQQRLWFLHQLDPGNTAYNISSAVRLRGDLDRAALTLALLRVIERHEPLRTTFPSTHGIPSQHIATRPTTGLRWLDLRSLPQARRQQELIALAQQEAQEPFDLSRGPLLRCWLLLLEPQEHLLVLSLHHIISDGWSHTILLRELSTLYRALHAREAISLPPLPVHYADYALWQRTWLQGEVLERQLDYWRSQLAGLTPLALPTDAARPSRQTFGGAQHQMLLPLALREQVRTLAQQEGVTLFMLLLAAFQVLLARWSGQQDIAVGIPIANRRLPEVEGLIGFFVNTVVVRSNLSGNPSFRQLLERVREVCLRAYMHQDVPFEEIVRMVQPERTRQGSPLFQVIFDLQNTPLVISDLPDLTLSPLEFHPERTTKFDLTVIIADTPQGMNVMMEYNTDLFRSSTIRRMSEHFKTLLGSIVTQPDTGIHALEIATHNERKQLLMKRHEQNESRLKHLREIKPRVISPQQNTMVTMEQFQPLTKLPLVMRPAIDTIDAAGWVQANRALVEKKLLEHGAILFRGFDLSTVAAFEHFAQAMNYELFNENGEHPRESVSGNVYTPTFYPKEKHLLWHNENSFNAQWPMKIWFGCEKPAESGGETPVVDSRKMFELLPPSIREPFQQKNIMYVRNYHAGLGVSWQEVFRTTSKSVVEEMCKKALIDFAWKDGGRLMTRSVRPAVIKHPKTGEWSWFNQAQHWHISCLDPDTRTSLQSMFQHEDLPRNCYYGDGSPIDDSVIAEICALYRELEVAFPWQKGDVLLLDNVLAAHARNPYVGERKILVAMGDMLSQQM